MSRLYLKPRGCGDVGDGTGGGSELDGPEVSGGLVLPAGPLNVEDVANPTASHPHRAQLTQNVFLTLFFTHIPPPLVVNVALCQNLQECIPQTLIL